MRLDGRVAWFLVPQLDESPDKNLTIPHDGAEGSLALEHLLERTAVGRDGGQVRALRIRAGSEELGDADRNVLVRTVSS